MHMYDIYFFSLEMSNPILMENLSASLPEAACSQQVSEPSSEKALRRDRHHCEVILRVIMHLRDSARRLFLYLFAVGSREDFDVIPLQQSHDELASFVSFFL